MPIDQEWNNMRAVVSGDGVETLPFSNAEYERRLTALRRIMAKHDVSATVLTSMHNIAYYSGSLYCSFGRPYACVVTAFSSLSNLIAVHLLLRFLSYYLTHQ